MGFVLPSCVLYLLATLLLVRAVAPDAAGPPRAWRLPALLAIALHGGYHLWVAWRTPGGPDMHFFAALSLVSLGMAAMTALVARGRMAAVGVVSFPLAALLLAVYHGYGHRPSSGLDWRLQLHAWLALLSYATLAVAALLAIMLWVQERALRRREFHAWLRALPPLTELETLLFRTIAVGFALLTATLLTGMMFVENLFAQHLVHKTVLSVLSWLVFGGLLLGRWRRGWRGTTAVRWTLVAMALLLLAFFGSKAVLELILQRTL
ncbi:cytochrome c biogenesis protein CcsA [Pseudoxanthomonas winnipegensis]|uniref:cytochrome C assembly family protein n=1 Tax=Pseudoxanthomonas winnipegensis TaxID=2480810 RepID=UPI002576C129|nr:cytochrome c biogenesis protein CcsA [Pseudoxanthomonas winnipegensis]WJI17083.1 cytochrome c biogenesis protein CcsA [Pseudoxanthomonas winnipegensis]